jgi:hypothetical protein
MLIKDLEQFQYDNKDPMLSHISDALGYACWHFQPIKRNIDGNTTEKYNL